MVNLYFHTNDPSKRKAINWLTAHGIEVKQRNLEKQPLTKQEVRQLLALSINGTDDLISLRSRDTKALELDKKVVTIDELTAAIQVAPRILKNPVIFDRTKLVTGFDKEKMGIFIPQPQRRLELSRLLAKFAPNPQPKGQVKFG